MTYRIYEQLGREEMKKADRGITMINHTQAEAMGILTNVLYQVGVTTLIAKFLILDILIDRDTPIVVCRGFLRTIGGIVNTLERLFLTFDGFCHQAFRVARSDVLRTTESDSDDKEEYEIKRNKFGASIYGPKPAPYLNCNDLADRSLALQKSMRGNDAEAGSSRSKRSRQLETMKEGGPRSDDHVNSQEYWLSISREENLGLSRSHASTIRNPILRVIHKKITYDLCQRTTGKGAGTQREGQIYCGQFITKIARKARVLTDVVLRSLSASIYYRHLDTTTLRELIDSESRLILEDPQPVYQELVFLDLREHRCMTCMIGWVIWRYVSKRLRGWNIGSHITKIVLSAVPTLATTVSTAVSAAVG
ncbi:hypothetical protein Tco_0703726 [Tanacetum coccineum]|uniref:Uncharacterized protein n=1 Tax=Tanacetum coccineum TaxID=301880 RepID=A0ABQ4Y1F7_9ASTR